MYTYSFFGLQKLPIAGRQCLSDIELFMYSSTSHMQGQCWSCKFGQLLSRLTVQGSVWMLPWRRTATVNASWFVMRVVICIPIWFLVWRYDGYWYCPKGDMNYSKVASSSPTLLGRSYSYGTQRHCGSPGVVPVWGIHAAPLLNELSFNSGALDCLGLELFDLLSSWVLKIDVSGIFFQNCLYVVVFVKVPLQNWNPKLVRCQGSFQTTGSGKVPWQCSGKVPWQCSGKFPGQVPGQCSGTGFQGSGAGPGRGLWKVLGQVQGRFRAGFQGRSGRVPGHCFRNRVRGRFRAVAVALVPEIVLVWVVVVTNDRCNPVRT